jgi:hypothetical protein
MLARLPRALPAVALLTAAALWLPSTAGADTTSNLTLLVQVQGRTRLTVSTRVLHFDVVTPGAPAVATLDFVAASRTRSDGEVILTVEPQTWVDGPGGAADVETEVSFTGEGAGALSGRLAPATPVMAGRWTGSGKRSGRLSFNLRAGAEGAYALPVRLVLSAP